MHFVVVFLLIAVYATSVNSYNEKNRLLIATNSISFTTFTVLKVTTTTTSTFTSTSTCTTSTATLTTCTIGRRRRGLFYDESNSLVRNRRGLFYYDDEVDSKHESVFLPSDRKTEDNGPAVQDASLAPKDQTFVVPLEIEAGFSLPNGNEHSRFLLSFGTFTITSVKITTSTVSLTAFCLSTSGFPLCGGVRK